ncbi:uncharacterized protein [Prorops nasuta]|uniref:uncharacterized protein n=1 Tax=Prorops nasuta TaxID=863751 RepID=UPI0034D013D0
MKVQKSIILLGCYILVLSLVSAAPNPQEPSFELPVQLVGFPVIIAAVRISNFVKKLAYSLNPQTYVSRAKRSSSLVIDEEMLDVRRVEKKLVEELGSNVCIFERVCSKYATQSRQRKSKDLTLDWDDIVRQYVSSPQPMKQNYLLSVFLGNIIGSPRLCHQLVKRGRGCSYNLSD